MRTKFTFLAILALLFGGCNSNIDGPDVEAPDGAGNPHKISISILKQRALDYGEAFGRTQTKASQVTVKDVVPLSSVLGYSTRSDGDANAPQLYIVNFANDEGFAIMVDDSRLGVAPYGYATNGNVNYPLDNPAFEDYLGELNGSINERYDWINTSPIPEMANYRPNTMNLPFSNWGTTDGIEYTWWYTGRDRHPVMLSSKVLGTPNFGQWAPYNLQLPMEGGGYYPTGCVATAMAIIMAHHRWPESITTSTGEVRQIDWDKALSGNPANSNIDYLMKDIGVQVHMSYSPDGSGAHSEYAPGAFIHYGLSTSTLDYYYTNIFDKPIKDRPVLVSNIDNEQPFYMKGNRPEGFGHAWVVDGYMYLTDNVSMVTDYVNIASDGFYYLVGQRVDPNSTDLYFHMNWGHDGNNNGFFYQNSYVSTASSPLFPQDKPNDDRKYTENRKVIYDIKKI